MFKLSSDVLANFRGVQSALRELLDKIADIYRRLRYVEDRVQSIPVSAANNPTITVGATFDGLGAALVVGTKVYVRVPVACTITEATALADQSGSAVVDVWVDSYSNYPPTDADSITASSPITITATTKSTDTALTGWDTAVAAGDVVAFHIDSCSTITRLQIQLKAIT